SSSQSQPGTAAAPLASRASGKPAPTMVRRHQLRAARLSSTPVSVASTSAVAGASASIAPSRYTSQHTPHASTAGKGQGRRGGIGTVESACHQPVTRSAVAVAAELVDQAVEFFERAELDRHLTEFEHPATAFDALLDADIDSGSQQVGQ